MKAVILAGGLGTRLRPLTYSIPKPLLPVGEKPILEIIINRLKSFAIRQIILMVGYRPELIEVYFGDGTKFDVDIQYVCEEHPLGTAGPLALVRQEGLIGADETFLVMNGDILTKLDFEALCRYHQEGNFDLTVATRCFEYQSPYGVLMTDDGRVQSIKEKPVTSYEISAGIYLLQGSVLAEVPAGTYFGMPDLIEKLLQHDYRVGAYPFDGYWLAVEQLHHIEEAHHDMAKWLDEEELT